METPHRADLGVQAAHLAEGIPVPGCPHGGGAVHVVATIKLMAAEPLTEPGVVSLWEHGGGAVEVVVSTSWWSRTH